MQIILSLEQRLKSTPHICYREVRNLPIDRAKLKHIFQKAQEHISSTNQRSNDSFEITDVKLFECYLEKILLNARLMKIQLKTIFNNQTKTIKSNKLRTRSH